MRLLNLSEIYDDNVEGKKANESDYNLLLDETAKVLKPDGTLLCILLKNSIPKEVANQAWPVLKKMKITSQNRGNASGEERYVLNKTNMAIPVESGIIGYFERTPRMPFCRACAWNLNDAHGWSLLQPLIKNTDSLFKEHAPDRYEIQKQIADKTSKDFMIKDTIFTTMTVNRNFRTGYHRDAGNLKDGISCMTVLQEGLFSGANLVFPKYKVAVKLRGMDTIIFDPQEVHGNTPLISISKESIRCSVVYYFREKIQECGTAEEELDRVKNRKQGESLHSTKLRKNHVDNQTSE